MNLDEIKEGALLAKIKVTQDEIQILESDLAYLKNRLSLLERSEEEDEYWEGHSLKLHPDEVIEDPSREILFRNFPSCSQGYVEVKGKEGPSS